MKKIEQLRDLSGFTGLVLFSSPVCAPCKGYKPVLERFSADAGVALGLIDVIASAHLAGVYGIRSVPTTVYFVNGSPGRQQAGVLTMLRLSRLTA